MVKKINYLDIDRNLKLRGFYVLNNFLSNFECENFLKKILNKNLIKDVPGKFHKGAQMVYNLQNKDEDFIKLIFNKKLNKICQKYFRHGSEKNDKDIYQFDALHSRILSGKCKEQSLHIDSRVCGINPPTHLHFFIYLSDVQENDGPTQLVPCSHKFLKYPTNRDKKKAIKIIGKRGTMIVINSSTWHGSSLKNSIKERAILTLSYSRWHIRQTYAVPYSIPIKIEKLLNLKQKKILGYFNYPPKNEKYRLRMRGQLTTLKSR